eukprot:8561862-Pyramimonas_sp.AAC.1
MDHISIRRMQIILAKVFVILGGRLEIAVSFDGFAPPSSPDQKRWGAHLSYDGNHPELQGVPPPQLENLAFDVIVGAEGERSLVGTLAQFETKVFQGPRALGITFNFVNGGSKLEKQLTEFAIIR